MKTPTKQITYPVCQKGNLSRRKKLRYGGVGGCIGLLFLIPSVLVLIAMFTGISEMNPDPNNEADAIAVGVVGIVYIMPAFFFFLLGLFLCRSVKVLKCDYCDSTQDAY